MIQSSYVTITSYFVSGCNSFNKQKRKCYFQQTKKPSKENKIVLVKNKINCPED
jgi:hypothetical protein